MGDLRERAIAAYHAKLEADARKAQQAERLRLQGLANELAGLARAILGDDVVISIPDIPDTIPHYLYGTSSPSVVIEGLAFSVSRYREGRVDEMRLMVITNCSRCTDHAWHYVTSIDDLGKALEHPDHPHHDDE